jgi:hypothetical protein
MNAFVAPPVGLPNGAPVTHLDPDLTGKVQALLRSLDVQSYPGGNQPYSPDAFLNAIKERHDALVKVADALDKRHAAQEAREAELAAREQRVKFEEERVAGLAQLGDRRRWRLF